jgi:hypothetical protein
MLIKNGEDSEGNRILSKDAVKNMIRSRVIVNGYGSSMQSISGYGLGWSRLSYRGHDIVMHEGSAPGFSALVMFAPQDKVGFAILNNVDNQQMANKDIAWRLFETAIGIEPMPAKRDAPIALNNDPRTPAPATVREKQSETNVSSECNPLPALNLTMFAGTYESLGYGAGFELCTATSTSTLCRSVISNFTAAAKARGKKLETKDLYAVWPRLWTKHLRLTYGDNGNFGFRPGSVFAHGYGNDQTAFEIYDHDIYDTEKNPRAEFVCDQDKVAGFGLRGTVSEETMREKQGGSTEDVADAWFVKTS